MSPKRTFPTSMLQIPVATAALLAALVTPAGASTLADFEGGVPAGWFTFSGASTVTTVVQTVADGDPLARPGQFGNNQILSTGYMISDFGGFGQDLVAVGGPQNWSHDESFDFWFYGTGSGFAYQAEISDNRSDPALDTSERFDYSFTDNTPGWQFISIPFADFTRATDFQPGGAPDDGFTLTEIWAWAIVLPQGTDTVFLDDVALGRRIVDDFESGLPSGTDGDGVTIGFLTFSGGGPASISTTVAPPAPIPGGVGANTVLQFTADVSSFAGFIHAFENDPVDVWVSQDWSAFEGISFWLYGNNSGTDLFIDLLENRNPGSTVDDAERWTVAFEDDFSGWQFFELPFAGFSRKEIGNGAPNDGLSLTEVHGWAFGTLDTGGLITYYIDDVGLFGIAEVPELSVGFAASNFDVVEGNTGSISVKLNRAMGGDDPVQVSVDYTIEPGSAIPDRDYVPTAGTLTFVNGGSSEMIFPLETFDNDKHEGDKRVILRLSNPVDVAPGLILQASGTILDDDPFDPALIDDFESYPYLWDSSGNVILSNLEIAADDPLAVPGQDDLEGVLHAVVPLWVEIDHPKKLCNSGQGVVPVTLLSTATFDATTVDHSTVRLGDAYETHVDARTGGPKRHEEDADHDGDIDLVFHFRYDETGLPCEPEVVPFNGRTFAGRPISAGGSDARFGRSFPLGQDWSAAGGLRFWYYGQNTGDTIVVELLDNRAPDPGPGGWSLVWSDEFNRPAGTPPDPANWGYEIGDGTANGIPGWGNSELQYYTDSAENAAMDGSGNLMITAREADGSLGCYYGPCEYTSARLLTRQRAEFAYGRIESRLEVPVGSGMWAAFWSLGINIDEVGWPQTGEIDFMEFVGREPSEIFGTIHGPGYSGGNSFGDVYFFGVPVFDDFHTFAIEWQPDLIEWYVDDVLYHTAAPDDVAPNEWVFNSPFYLLMNLALGGNFGGPVGDDTIFPQTMLVDYVRVYQGPDTAERFEISLIDDFSGWQEVVVPFDAFARSIAQPDGAPDDGLTLTEVWGYGFRLPEGSSSGSLLIADVRLERPSSVTVQSTDDSGPGSLREAIAAVAGGGTILFDPGLAGGVVTLSSGPLSISGKTVTIDAHGAPGLRVSGGGADRVLIVDTGASANVSHLVLTHGFGWQLAGCVLNNGTLNLDHVTVTGCTMATDAGDFWQGGGGIYNGDGATLYLTDSSVTHNTAGWSGGGVYSFFNTTTSIVRSTISGNVSNDVGGGLRSLGNAEIANSTISGNEATAWHGGALFITDGVVNVSSSTVADNVSPSGTAAVFVGTFTNASATLTLINSIVAHNAADGCFLAPFGAGAVAIHSLGHNVATDGSCFPVASDQIVVSAGLEPLAARGGPTETHGLALGSPAIDAADGGACPPTDQRGVARPQGGNCDVGAFEYVPWSQARRSRAGGAFLAAPARVTRSLPLTMPG